MVKSLALVFVVVAAVANGMVVVKPAVAKVVKVKSKHLIQKMHPC
jgi:hypothetical protein